MKNVKARLLGVFFQKACGSEKRPLNFVLWLWLLVLVMSFCVIQGANSKTYRPEAVKFSNGLKNSLPTEKEMFIVPCSTVTCYWESTNGHNDSTVTRPYYIIELEVSRVPWILPLLSHFIGRSAINQSRGHKTVSWFDSTREERLCSLCNL